MRLSETEIKKYLGSTYFQRGKEYFKRGRVSKFHQEERGEGDFLTADVQGSHGNHYRTSLYIKDGEIVESGCDCPLRGDCKHVGAVYLFAMEQENQKAIATEEETNAADSLSNVSANKKKVPNWAERLKAFIAPQTEDEKQQLQIYIKIRPAPTSYSGNPREKIMWQMQLRPRVFFPATGSFSDTALSFNDVLQDLFNMKKSLISPEQKNFLRQLTLALGIDYYSYDKWQTITTENAPLVWTTLKEASANKVKLVTGKKEGREIKINSGMIRVGLLARDKGKGIQLQGVIQANNKQIADEMVIVGEIFAASVDISSVGAKTSLEPKEFYPIDANIDKQAKEWLDRSIVIPETDTAQFTAQFLPRILRTMPIINQSKKLIIPKISEPKLRVGIAKHSELGIAVKLDWDYDGEKISYDEPLERENTDVAILRDVDRENEMKATLRQMLLPLRHSFTDEKLTEVKPQFDFQKQEARLFLQSILPRLEGEPWAMIEKDNDLPEFSVEEEAPQIKMAVEESGDGAAGQEHDWFDLQMHISAGGHKVPFGDVFTALANNQKELFLENGKVLPLDTPLFANLKSLIEQARHLRNPQKEGFTVSRYQAGWWEELASLGIVEEQAKSWKSAMNGLLKAGANIKKFKKVPVDLQATLRPYQEDGLAWLRFLLENNLGGILADDMGLGKTVQTIAALCATSPKNKKSQPWLIIAPTSVVENWDMEIQRFAPRLHQVILRKGDRSKDHQDMSQADVVVTSYALANRDFEILRKIDWRCIVLDEAQFIKNHQSKTYGVIRKLSARSKIALTGTPLENSILELWSLFSVVAPGLLPPPEQFREIYQRPIEKQGSKEMLQQLQRRIRPFMLRRKKELVEKELPPKQQQVLWLEMDAQQRKIYDLQLQHERQKVLGLLAEGGLKSNRFEILTSLMRLRQLCLHATLVDKKYAKVPSVKLDTLIEQLQPIIDEGHKVLVFSQFTSFLSLAREQLEEAKITYSYLDGSTRNRKAVIKKFTDNPEVPLFLISLKAGAVGLNLTAADYCIILDPWWNPAVENQAVDRAHRIGQKRTVIIYKFIVKDTIEEKVLKLQERKQKLFQSVIDDGDAFSPLITEDDIKSIFE